MKSLPLSTLVAGMGQQRIHLTSFQVQLMREAWTRGVVNSYMVRKSSIQTLLDARFLQPKPLGPRGFFSIGNEFTITEAGKDYLRSVERGSRKKQKEIRQ